jgi:hypothetical protein
MRLRRLALAALLPLLLAVTGCPDDDDDRSCDSKAGSLLVCICWDEEDDEPVTDALVMIRTELADPYPIDALVGPDGCTEVSLPAGEWEWSARTSGLHCVSPFEAATVTACETAERKVALMQWCMVGGFE